MIIKKSPSWRTKSSGLRCNIRHPTLTPLHLGSVQLLHVRPSYPKLCYLATRERPNLRRSGKQLQIRGFRSQKPPWGLMAAIHPALCLLLLLHWPNWESEPARSGVTKDENLHYKDQVNSYWEALWPQVREGMQLAFFASWSSILSYLSHFLALLPLDLSSRNAVKFSAIQGSNFLFNHSATLHQDSIEQGVSNLICKWAGWLQDVFLTNQEPHQVQNLQNISLWIGWKENLQLHRRFCTRCGSWLVKNANLYQHQSFAVKTIHVFLAGLFSSYFIW